jgi:ComF family protein
MGLASELKLTWEALWELIFPSRLYCAACKGSLDQASIHGLCKECLKCISFVGAGRWIQSSCSGGNNKGTRMYSVVIYKAVIKEMIHDFKYNRRTYLSRIFAGFMRDFMDREGLEADLIIPVPLYSRRERLRGFNQAALLAKYLSRSTGIAYEAKNLMRTRNTAIMHNLSVLERRENVNAAFRLKNPQQLLEKRILLIDDILTTGATIEECSRILYEAGAAEVTALTLAKGVPEKD